MRYAVPQFPDDPKLPGQCGCSRCRTDRNERHPSFPQFPIHAAMMILCESCGNKRCPHADDHRFLCTESNDDGQIGQLDPTISARAEK